MFMAIALTCLTIDRHNCSLTYTEPFPTQIECLASVAELVAWTNFNQPNTLVVEFQCVRWDYKFPNA